MPKKRVDILPMARAVALLQQGMIVAFPTESWYGLAVDPFNAEALDRLFVAKRRPANKPILVLISARQQLQLLVRDIPACYFSLMRMFWPGPLTLVFPARTGLPGQLTAGTGTVAIRHSRHPLAVRLVKEFGGPLTATSANISGAKPQTTAAGVAASLGSAVDLIVDGGRTAGGPGSTVVTCLDNDKTKNSSRNSLATRREKYETISCIRKGRVAFSAIQSVMNAAGFTENRKETI